MKKILHHLCNSYLSVGINFNIQKCSPINFSHILSEEAVIASIMMKEIFILKKYADKNKKCEEKTVHVE